MFVASNTLRSWRRRPLNENTCVIGVRRTDSTRAVDARTLTRSDRTAAAGSCPHALSNVEEE